MLNRHWTLLASGIKRDRHEPHLWEKQADELDELEVRTDLTAIEIERMEFLRTLRAKGVIG